MLIHGIAPSQYSGCRRLGVCPDSSLATSPSATHRQPIGAELDGIPTERARVGGICLVVAARPRVAVAPVVPVLIVSCASIAVLWRSQHPMRQSRQLFLVEFGTKQPLPRSDSSRKDRSFRDLRL